MQAISTIRLLLCSGEVRSVLLVCPKPLVTNWLREFQRLGAGDSDCRDRRQRGETGIPVAVAQVPVKVANYELLMRDQAIVDR